MEHPAAQQILNLYQRHADAFVRLRSRALFEKSWLDAFLAAVGKTGHILDIGCGTGEPIAAYFMAQGYTLTGAATYGLAPKKTDYCDTTMKIRQLQNIIRENILGSQHLRWK